MNPDNVEELRKLVVIQGNDGNWNYSDYMRGMFNGMELMLAILEDREPKFRDAPEHYLEENPNRIPVSEVLA